MRAVRCAIYTRKSSDEGLEQDFNSLDAQREACAAYILSQASEGWTALPDRYDDGGLSGGTLERPALQRLMADVAAGRVDTIVVYKIDRLTRSLFDFVKLVEQFDKMGTSFVSVTQAFNTTTSMGRLTLNMLLSFAQFEREVTAERIRDKIAASKAKGMWMGGIPPLGYEPDGRSLKIVDAHADIVRDIFERYVRLGNVRHVAEQIDRDGIISPVRIKAKTGIPYGGVRLTRGQIYGILKCPTYVGEVHHKGQVYAGQHPAIVDRELWHAVQAKLADNLRGHRDGVRARQPGLLSGLVIDADGAPLLSSHATAGKTRYRYYVSKALHHSDGEGIRIPATELEGVVCQQLAAELAEPLGLAARLGIDLRADQVMELVERGQAATRQLKAKSRTLVRELVEQVVIHDGRIEIRCRARTFVEQLGLTSTEDIEPLMIISCDVRLTRTGRVVRLVQTNGAPLVAATDKSLVNMIVRAHGWWKVLREGKLNVSEYAVREGVHPSYMSRVLRLAFLSPTITEAIIGGTLATSKMGAELIAAGAMSGAWEEQKALLSR